MEYIYYAGYKYPHLQSTGNAARYCMEAAKQVCIGKGVDVGYGKEEWKFPEAIGVDFNDNNDYHAMNLPEGEFDFIFSSHFLEHYIGRFQDVIEYWLTKIKKGGIIFLYLPNCEHQKYWAWGNKKHIHYLTPKILKEFAESELHPKGNRTYITEGYDINSSFYCIITKNENP